MRQPSLKRRHRSDFLKSKRRRSSALARSYREQLPGVQTATKEVNTGLAGILTARPPGLERERAASAFFQFFVSVTNLLPAGGNPSAGGGPIPHRELIPMMPEPRLRPLVERFGATLLEIPVFDAVYGII